MCVVNSVYCFFFSHLSRSLFLSFAKTPMASNLHMDLCKKFWNHKSNQVIHDKTT